MMRIVSTAEMRQLEAAIFAAGTGDFALLDAAGSAAAALLLEFLQTVPAPHRKRIVILAGRGSNGGDGLVIARKLAEAHLPIVVYSTVPTAERRGAVRQAAEMLAGLAPLEVRETLTPEDFAPGDLLVDALLGTGAAGAPRGAVGQWLPVIRAAGLPTVSIDLPTGLDADTGKAAETAVIADLTITIGLPKHGLVLADGPHHTGQLAVAPLPFAPGSIAALGTGPMALNGVTTLRRVANDAYKHLRGRVLAAGGSAEYCGAPVLCAEGALAGGAGLVRLLVPGTMPLAGSIPHALLLSRTAPGAPSFTPTDLPLLREAAETADAVVLGCGLGRSNAAAEFVQGALALERPLVLDADALTLAAHFPAAVAQRTAGTILTPHPGEAARLAGALRLNAAIERDALAAALAQRLNAVTVLKGCRTVVAAPQGESAVNLSGSPALAAGGSGDCLAGLTAALLAVRPDAPFPVACDAVWLHGRAGELAAERYGIRGTWADRLPECLADAMKEASFFA